MADFLTKTERSIRMAAIRGRNNQTTEAVLVALLRKHRIWGWRRHLPLIGRPDFVFRKDKLVIFVDGCFWHGCHRHAHKISTNRKFWDTKIKLNQERDRRNSRALRRKGWTVLRIWEHQLREGDKVISHIQAALLKKS
jgi:DNA mismatch endonuclease (patch repair protein)